MTTTRTIKGVLDCAVADGTLKEADHQALRIELDGLQAARAALPDEIFLLYGGSSADGRGQPEYEGRTADAREAYEHWKRLDADYSSTGEVRRITATEQHTMRGSNWARYRF